MDCDLSQNGSKLSRYLFGSMTQSPSPNNKPPLLDQAADIILKLIVVGGIPAGGIGAIWTYVEQSDLPKAAVTFLIGVGTTYAASWLKPLHEGNQRRFGSLGQATNSAIDSVSENLITAATRFDDKYLLCQASDCEAARSEGMVPHDGIFAPLLKEVFVPLELDTSATLPGYSPSTLKPLTPDQFERENLTIWDFLAEAKRQQTYRQLVILAWGGYGKTTLLKHIAYLYGTKQQPSKAPKQIPVLIVLRKYRELLAQDEPPDLPKLITELHIPDLPGAQNLQVPENWAKNMLEKGRAVVMLDGFDEVAKEKRPTVAKWIHQQMRQYGQSIFIVTSRPKAYKEQDAADRLQLVTPLWVRDFDADQRQKFVSQWYQCQMRYASGGRDTPEVQKRATDAAKELLDQIEARQELKDLAKNPLLLNMIVTFHRRFPGAELPKRRVELYREICQLQLKDRPRARTLDTLLTECEPQKIIQQLALMMMQERLERIDQPLLLSALSYFLKDESVDATAFLEQVVQISELLVEREPEEYEFAHLSFQEYLTAVEIHQENQEAQLYQSFEDDWWKPTILFYAALTKQPTNLITAVLSQGEVNFAYACLQETTKHIDSNIANVFMSPATLYSFQNTIRMRRYAKLEHHLKNGEWKKADDETYRLMITAIGKEEGQGFTSDELLNFPCDELLTIDGLWVKYSNGRFGFSVQKDIYLSKEVGGIADGKYHPEAFNKLVDKVGWRRVKNFDIASPQGHLPFCVVVGVVRDRVSLLSHGDL